jgi:PAB-dependent poly(A)-specific ribonuclease subunit 2
LFFSNHYWSLDLLVPPSQVMDTVNLFHMKGQRKISLKYLAWYLLGLNIQRETHCSIEDARTALALYKIYLDVQKKDQFDALLHEIYTVGRSLKWQPTGPRPTIIASLETKKKKSDIVTIQERERS